MPVPTSAAATFGVLMSVCAAGTFAQTVPSPLPSRPLSASSVVLALTAEQLLDVERWVRDYEQWKTWFAQWRNRPEPGLFSSRPRRPKPEPPAWLGDACTKFPVEDEGVLADGCRAWHEWRRNDYAALFMQQKVAQSRADKEAPRKTIWWEHIHLDALWPMTQSGSNAFGVFGVHATLRVTDRFQIFVAPGAILMRIPTRDGGRAWTAASDWGFSYRMFDFRMPVTGRLSSLHANIARVWVLGTNPQPVGDELYLAGFSLSFKAHPNPPSTPSQRSQAAGLVR